jgi:hypothetical protein
MADTAPACVKKDPRVIASDLVEPDWCGWRRNPIKIFRMFRFIFRLRALARCEEINKGFLYGTPSPWHWLSRLARPHLAWTFYVHDPHLHLGESLKRRIFLGLKDFQTSDMQAC